MCVWELKPRSYRLLEAMKKHKAAVTCLKIKSDDTECVSASSDGTCIIWDIVWVAYLQTITHTLCPCNIFKVFNIVILVYEILFIYEMLCLVVQQNAKNDCRPTSLSQNCNNYFSVSSKKNDESKWSENKVVRHITEWANHIVLWKVMYIFGNNMYSHQRQSEKKEEHCLHVWLVIREKWWSGCVAHTMR